MNAARPTTPIDYETMMLDLRHSWRIVAAFQQRIFYLLREIEAGFPEAKFLNWNPAWNNRPPIGKSKPWERWNWDFLPLYAADYWFAPSNIELHDKLEKGDWFIVVRAMADSGYNNRVAKSTSFSGPDPMKMPPAEETETSIWLNIYEVTGESSAVGTPWGAWEADKEDSGEEPWSELHGLGTRVIRFGGTLETYLEDGAMAKLITKVRAQLIADGLPLNAKPTAQRSI